MARQLQFLVAIILAIVILSIMEILLIINIREDTIRFIAFSVVLIVLLDGLVRTIRAFVRG